MQRRNSLGLRRLVRLPSCLFGLFGFLTLAACSALGQEIVKPALQPQDMALEDLLRQPLRQVPRDVEVSTSSRFAQSATQAPGTTYVITAEDISRFGFRNMADILRAMPGLYVTQGFDFSFVGARGLGRPGDPNARLLFLLDGVRLNENVYDAGQIDEDFFVDVGLIERVEFSPGPGSALYGNNAFLGVIQVISKRADKLAGAQAFASLDSEGMQRLRASWGHRSEAGWEGWIAASQTRQDHRPAPIDLAHELEAAPRDRLWLRGRRLLMSFSAAGWQLRGGTSELRQGELSEAPDTLPPHLGQAELGTENDFLSLSHERGLGPDWDLFAGLSIKRSKYRERQPWQDPETQQPNVYAMTSFGRWWNADVRLSSHRWAGHRVMAGLDIQRDDVQEIAIGREGEAPSQVFFGINRRIGLFFQDEWQLGSDQSLLLGLRRDSSSVSEASVNPRLAWVWNGWSNATLRLTYGSAFRAANLSEYASNASWEAPLPRPERIKSFEASWEHSITPTLQYRVSLYRSMLSELIDQNRTDLPIYENSAHLRSVGGDIDVEQRWRRGSVLRLSLSLQRSRDAAGRGLSNSPGALFKLFYSQPLLDNNWQLSWQLLAMSRRLNLDQTVPGYGVNHLSLLWRPSLDLTLSLGLYNLGDIHYVDRPVSSGIALKQPGRTGQISLNWRFGR